MIPLKQEIVELEEDNMSGYESMRGKKAKTKK